MEQMHVQIQNQFFQLASLGKTVGNEPEVNRKWTKNDNRIYFRRKKFPQIKMSDWVRSPSNLEKKFRLIYFISFVGKGTTVKIHREKS